MFFILNNKEEYSMPFICFFSTYLLIVSQRLTVTPKRCEGRPEKTITTFQIQFLKEGEGHWLEGGGGGLSKKNWVWGVGVRRRRTGCGGGGGDGDGQMGREEVNPDAQGMANKEIHNWDEGAETYYDATEAMADEEDDFDISSHSVQSEKGRRLPSTLSTTQGQASTKRVKKNVLLMLFMMLLYQLSNTLKVRKKNEDNRPSAKVIHEVVSSVGGLARNDVFKATQRLMNGNVQEFELLRDLRDDEKEEWIKFLLDN
ncbi:hypothetical protein LIER_41913 [Lithospermum erythrorhizon]|uniref:Uncharacterized protein n=1 Tax=Lithospermum erythrorhizon TaxID=34254 RepID=A0AAV3RJU7_LITER